MGFITENQYLNPKISSKAFLYLLKNNINRLLSGNIIRTEEEINIVRGDSFIQASDGTFLGSLKPNKYDNDSIFNKYGPYGNKYSQTCIFNKYSQYGGQYSILSPYNRFSNAPPRIFLKGKHVGYLTNNQFIKDRIDPENILEWAENNVSKY
jgi:hypothetical protein